MAFRWNGTGIRSVWTSTWTRPYVKSAMRSSLRLTHVLGRLPSESYNDKRRYSSIVSISNVGIVQLVGRVLNSANDEIYDSLTTATQFF